MVASENLPTQSQQKTAPADCHRTSGSTHHVIGILDGKTVRLEDGSILSLKGIQTAEMSDTGTEPGASSRPDHKAHLSLKQLVLGRAITLRSGKPRRDRHNRILAHVFTTKDGTRLWIQGELVRSGLAMANPGPHRHNCSQMLLTLEQNARENDRGHWADRSFRIYRAWQTRAIASREQTFQLVEGRIRRVSRLRNKFYLNFGRDWKTDFTIVVGRRVARQLHWRGSEFKKLKGKKVRVRGWIEFNRGPLIRLAHPHDLEILPRRK